MDDNTKEELKARLKEYVEEITDPSKGGLYKCPLCASGTGQNGTGAFSIKGNRWHCFSCNEGGDIFDLVAKVDGITLAEAFTRTAQKFGVDDGRPAGQRVTSSRGKQAKARPARPAERPATHAPVYPEIQASAPDNLESTDYPQKRGISLATLRKYGVKYAPAWVHPNTLERHKGSVSDLKGTPRILFPTSKGGYTARYAGNALKNVQKVQKVGNGALFNAAALDSVNGPVFIVEGEMDALSVLEVGGEAVGIGGTSGVDALLEAVMKLPPAFPLIVAMDNDEAGRKAEGQLMQKLKDAGIDAVALQPWGECKDASELLERDRAALEKVVQGAAQAVEQEAQAEKEKALDAYNERMQAARFLQSFLEEVEANRFSRCIPTGIPALDAELDGGLYPGLYIIGAISSLGKTTLALQIADNMAQAGQDVLIFSLEMARAELMAKSISRLTVLLGMKYGEQVGGFAKTTRGILDGSRYDSYSKEVRIHIKDCLEAYKPISKHVFIVEGSGDVGAEQVRAAVKEHENITGRTPVVIVDYLQILAPADVRASDKQNTDKAIIELKRISRDYNTPVLAVSSLNRANYNTPISMEAMKESGAIEYSSDVLIGLQLQGVGGKDFDVNAAKAKNPRDVEAVILKNRNGKTGGKVPMIFYSMFNVFQ